MMDTGNRRTFLALHKIRIRSSGGEINQLLAVNRLRDVIDEVVKRTNRKDFTIHEDRTGIRIDQDWQLLETNGYLCVLIRGEEWRAPLFGVHQPFGRLLSLNDSQPPWIGSAQHGGTTGRTYGEIVTRANTVTYMYIQAQNVHVGDINEDATHYHYPDENEGRPDSRPSY